jgi:hypothetical protein
MCQLCVMLCHVSAYQIYCLLLGVSEKMFNKRNHLVSWDQVGKTGRSNRPTVYSIQTKYQNVIFVLLPPEVQISVFASSCEVQTLY